MRLRVARLDLAARTAAAARRGRRRPRLVGGAGQQRAALVEHADRLRVQLGHAATTPGARCRRPARGRACGPGAASAAPRRSASAARGRSRSGSAARGARARSAPRPATVIERVSSPSRPRWKVRRSWNWVWPKRALSISSKPTTEPLGRPADASFRRTSCTLRGRHQDRARRRRHAVGHVHLRQLGDDRAAVLVGQVGVEHLVVALAAPQSSSRARRRPARRCRRRALSLLRAGIAARRPPKRRRARPAACGR